MIFVSVGSMMPFDRLIRTVDAWAATHPHIPVLAQIGKGNYEPCHGRFVRMMSPADYTRAVADSRLFIAHAGMGSIITAIQLGKPLLMLARHRELGEHNSNHQLATIRNVGNRTGLYHVESQNELGAAIDRLLLVEGDMPTQIAPFASDELLDSVRRFVSAD